MTNSSDSYIDSRMNTNYRSDIAFLEVMGEKGNVDEIEVMVEMIGDEAKWDHLGNLDKYDPSIDIFIALREGTRSCTKHFICNYVSYENLSP